MAIRPKKPKKKKNPFRLSSDRQPGIAKANKGKKKKGPKGPRYIPLPNSEARFEQPLGRPTPEQIEQLPKFKDIFKKTKSFPIPALGGKVKKYGKVTK